MRSLRSLALCGCALIALLWVAPSAWPAQTSHAPDIQNRKQDELTIRNATQQTIAYEIVSVGEGGARYTKTIAPGVVHRFPGSVDRDIFFESSGKKLSYRLNAKHPYAFRYDENQRLDLYQASHGWTDVVDLAPFLPTPMPVVERMLALAHVNANSVVYDLGCGDGRIVIAAAKEYKAHGVGVDLDAELIQTARAKAKLEGVENLTQFRMEDATRTDVSRATVVALYLLPESNELLRDRLERQLKPGSIVVSHNYRIKGWEAKEFGSDTVKTEDGQEHMIFLYRR
jgi:SAM-dependent methyltransferase